MDGEYQSSILYSLQNMTPEGMATVAILAAMSLLSWSVIVGKILALRRQRKRADRFYDRFYECKDPFELVGQDDEFEGAPPYSVYDYACREMQKLLDRFAPPMATHGAGLRAPIAGGMGRRAPGRALPRVRAAMERGLGDELTRLEGGMALLALAVSGGPFIGLFGTVLGVMDTFAAVGREGQANFSAIAPGVAGALLTTVLGLVVAIPALFAFNLLQRRIQGMELDMSNFASELEGVFVMDYVESGGAPGMREDDHALPSTELSAATG